MKHFLEPKVKQFLLVMAGVLLVVTLIGCQSTPLAVSAIELEPEPAPKVTLAPGDVIDIKFFYTPELNHTQAVRPDGKITLQLIGEVEAEGKTPSELRAELLELYLPHLKKPEVAVIVRSLRNRRVYVGGEVNTPGLIDMPGRLTALEAIMEAGGFNMLTAEVRNVVIIRHKDGRRYGGALDLEEALEGKEVKPFFLEPYDIVYVPQTTIAKVNQWIDQHINKLVPQTGLVYTVPVGTGTVTIDTSGG